MHSTQKLDLAEVEQRLNTALSGEQYYLDCRTNGHVRPNHSQEVGYPGIKRAWALKQRRAMLLERQGISSTAH